MDDTLREHASFHHWLGDYETTYLEQHREEELAMNAKYVAREAVLNQGVGE